MYLFLAEYFDSYILYYLCSAECGRGVSNSPPLSLFLKIKIVMAFPPFYTSLTIDSRGVMTLIFEQTLHFELECNALNHSGYQHSTPIRQPTLCFHDLCLRSRNCAW